MHEKRIINLSLPWMFSSLQKQRLAIKISAPTGTFLHLVKNQVLV